jgi:uncharacterized protein
MAVVNSRYNIPIPLKNGRRLVYNSLTQAMAVWDAEDVVAFDKILAREPDVDGQRYTDLAKGGFIVNEDVDELKLLDQMYQRSRFNSQNVMLTIAPTMACNFVCDYCFQGQDKPHATMTDAVQDSIISMLDHAAPQVKSVGVTWYGGEPLVRVKVIEALSDRMIELCQRKGLSYTASVVTNGYLLTKEVATSLVKRGVSWIQVTLDGTPEYHDTRRYLMGGKGSFHRIIENLRSFITELPRLAISIRVNIDDRNAKDIHGLLDYMAGQGFGKATPNLSIYFAPVEATTEGCHIVEDVTMQKSRYGQLEAELYAHAFELNLTPLPWPPRFHGLCGAVQPSSIVILPTGELHKCWDTVSWPEKSVGSIFNLPAVMQNELMQKWLRWTPFENETCKNCKILPNCAGSCAYKFIHSADTRGEAAILPCPSWKYNIKERLLQRAIGKGKLTKDDFDPEETRTIPSELCADQFLDGGKALPDTMAAAYEVQKKERRKLPVVTEVG